MIVPVVQTIILKVAAPCNLNCTYCYEYNRGDDTWKTKPKKIQIDTLRKLGRRIEEHVHRHDLTYFNLNLHGGEPMLLGAEGLDQAITAIKEAAPTVNLRLGMQTNATLTSDQIIQVLKRHRVSVGASLDGNQDANEHRIDHRGKGSWERATSGIKKLKSSGVLAGIQTVINLRSDPRETLATLHALGARQIEFGQPFGNHANPPHRYSTRTLGQWLNEAFDHWIRDSDLSKIRIPILEDAMRAIITGRSSSDWFPSMPPGYVVVATDGTYEGLDTLKVAGREGREFDLTLEGASIDEVSMHPFMVARSENKLCDTCMKCPIKRWCNGGYYPTRFSNEKGFNNPSIYCEDLRLMFAHIAENILRQQRIETDQRSQIESSLHALMELLPNSELGK